MNRDKLDNYIMWILDAIELDADQMPTDKCIEELDCIVKHIWTESTLEAFEYMGKAEQAEMDKAMQFLDKDVEK